MTRAALIVCGSPEAPTDELVTRLVGGAFFVVAVDSGADTLMRAGVTPDLLVGDSDSISAETAAWLLSKGVRSEIHPAHKDRTDLELALDAVAEVLPDEVWVTGASGGRPDHFLAVVGSVCRHAHLRPLLLESDYRAAVIAAGARESYSVAGESRTFSVIAPIGEAVVSVKGSEWELDHATLRPLDDRGVSNTVAGVSATVSVHQGVALVLIPSS